jgi:hypothetical protein
MTNVNLPNKSRSKTDPNLFSDVVENDEAIAHVVNGELTNANLSGTAGITGANIAESTITGAKLASPLAGAAKGSIIATEESRENTSYGALTTPDKVEGLVLPTKGLIFVAYQATWKSSNSNASRAALFLNGTQLKYVPFNKTTPEVNEAEFTNLGNFTLLSTAEAIGMVDLGFGVAYAGDVGTGQVLGAVGTGTPALRSGPVGIFADAGTYTIEVRFKQPTSGKVTVKNRRLYAWVREFS